MPSRIILLMFIITEFACTFMLFVTSYTCKITSPIPNSPPPPPFPSPSPYNLLLHSTLKTNSNPKKPHFALLYHRNKCKHQRRCCPHLSHFPSCHLLHKDFNKPLSYCSHLCCPQKTTQNNTGTHTKKHTRTHALSLSLSLSARAVCNVAGDAKPVAGLLTGPGFEPRWSLFRWHVAKRERRCLWDLAFWNKNFGGWGCPLPELLYGLSLCSPVFVGFAYHGKDIMLRFIIKYSSRSVFIWGFWKHDIFGLCWNLRLVIELWYLEGFWFL